MSKILAGTAFVLLSGATVTGGVLLTNAKSDKKADDADSKSDSVEVELAKDLATFKTSAQNQPCLKTLFAGLSNLNGTTDASTDPQANGFFEANKKTEGCLIVNWEKKNKTVGTSAQWHGTFRLLWAVKGEATGGAKRGFLVFLAGKTPTSGSTKEIQWEGAVYTLSGTGTETVTWTSKQRKELTSGTKSFKQEGSSVQNNQFPQAGTALKDSNNTAVTEFWGWFNPSSDLNTIYIGTDSVQNPESSLKARWDWEGKEGSTDSGSVKLIDWTKETDTWWNAIFDSSSFSVKTASDNRSGAWNQKAYSPTPKSST